MKSQKVKIEGEAGLNLQKQRAEKVLLYIKGPLMMTGLTMLWSCSAGPTWPLIVFVQHVQKRPRRKFLEPWRVPVLRFYENTTRTQ